VRMACLRQTKQTETLPTPRAGTSSSNRRGGGKKGKHPRKTDRTESISTQREKYKHIWLDMGRGKPAEKKNRARVNVDQAGGQEGE